MKVLVIQPKIGMGDMVIYLPYIHAISKKYLTPVSILVKENSRANELLFNDEYIDEIIILDRSYNNSGNHDGLSGFFKLSKELEKHKFDKVFIYNGSLRYFLISKLAGIKNISQYPLFRKKDNIVTSAKVFTESELNIIVSTQPELYINDVRHKKIQSTIEERTYLFRRDVFYGISITFVIPLLYYLGSTVAVSFSFIIASLSAILSYSINFSENKKINFKF